MSSPTLLAETRGELFGFRDVQGFRKLIQIDSPHWKGRLNVRFGSCVDVWRTVFISGCHDERFA
jgi:hypothetical protein